MESRPFREMDGGENPHAKTERKKGEFLYHFGHFVIRQDFVIKIGSSRKKWGNFSHPPTPKCAPGVARKNFFESGPFREMDGGENPLAKTERKKGNF